MTGKLAKTEVKRWIEGQKAAESVIERERIRRLLEITPEESLRVYIELKELAPDDPHAGPSPLLMAVRRVLKRYAEMKGGRE